MTPLEGNLRGFQFGLEALAKSERPTWKLIHEDWAEFSIKGYTPFIVSDLAKVDLKSMEQVIRISIDPIGMVNYLRKFRGSEQGAIPLSSLKKKEDEEEKESKSEDDSGIVVKNETTIFIEPPSKDPGFRFCLEIPGSNGRAVWKVIHTDCLDFCAQVWAPPLNGERLGPDLHYIFTTLKVMGQAIRIQVDTQGILAYLKNFRTPEELLIAPHAWKKTILHFVTDEGDEKEYYGGPDENPELDYWCAEKTREGISRYGFELDDFAQVGTGIDRAITSARENAQESILERLKREVIIACKKDSLERYLCKNAMIRIWKIHLSWSVTRKNLFSTVDYLYDILSDWDQQLKKKERIYHPRFGFEYRKNGTLWFDYKYQSDVGEQTHTINLNTGEMFGLVHYSQKMGEKILLLRDLFIEFYPREDLGRKFYVGRFELPEADLFTARGEYSALEKRKIALQLLSGLAVLRKEGIVHCGINPKGILFRFHKNGEVEAFFSPDDFTRAYSLDAPPEDNPFDPKWPECTPPECISPDGVISVIDHPHPFAIPIYQLWICFQYLFKGDSSPQIQAMLEGMGHLDVERRWDEILASKAISDFYVPPLSQSFVKRD